MNNKQLASFLNGAIKTNTLGVDVTVQEDLSNYIDFGKAVADLGDDDLKSFKKDIAVQIRNEVITRLLARKDFRMFKDSVAFGGALQRIINKGMLTVQDSHINNLVYGTDYFDGKYYGQNVDARLYMDVDSFKIPYSISDDDWRLFFTSVEDMRRVMGIIYNAETNTMIMYLNALVKRILMALIQSCNKGNRKVGLLTAFNDKTGGTYTIDQIYADRKLYAYFADFCKAVVEKLRVYMQEPNEKYNNGEVTTFTPLEDIDVVMISDFLSDIRHLGNPTDFNVPPLNVGEVAAWQNNTDAILPTLHDLSTILVTKDGEEGKEEDEIENVVGLIYDTQSCGITSILDKITSQYVGSEGYTTYFHHVANRYFYDDRFGSVILTLD